MKWTANGTSPTRCFRDLGAAFAWSWVLIYTLVVGWFGRSHAFIIMAAIPFSLLHPARALALGPSHRHLDDRLHGGRRDRVRQLIILVDFISCGQSRGCRWPRR